MKLETYSNSNNENGRTEQTDDDSPEKEELLNILAESENHSVLHKENEVSDVLGGPDVEREAGELQRGKYERQITHPTSYVETIVHFIKANIGTGMFAMGEAVRNAGLLMAPFLTLLLGFLGVFCQHQLMNASKATSRRLGLPKHPDFYDTVRLSFSNGPPRFRQCARAVSRLVNVLLVVMQLEFCCVYFVFISTNLKQVLDQYIAPIDARIYMLIILFPILLISWVRNLKYLVPVSLISNAMMCTGIGITIYMCLKDGFPDISERNLVSDWSRLPLFFGTVVYCFEAISLTMPLKNEMKVPHHFSMPCGVLNIGSTVIGLLLISLGSVSYMKFGEDIRGSVTLNLDQSSIVCQVIKLLICFGIMFTYPIQLFVPVDITWPLVASRVRGLPLLRGAKDSALPELAYRSALVLLTFLLAECIPRLGLFISLVGSMSGATLAFIIPPLLDWSWRLQAGEMSVIRHLANAAIILFGFLISGWGTYTAMEQIIEAFMSGDLSVT